MNDEKENTLIVYLFCIVMERYYKQLLHRTCIKPPHCHLSVFKYAIPKSLATTSTT